MFQVILVVCSIRIVSRPVISSETIEVIVNTRLSWRICVHWSIGIVRTGCNDVFRPQGISTCVSHVFSYVAADVLCLPINQTSSSRMTNQPVVNVAFDQDLSSSCFHCEKFMALKSVSFSGGVVKTGTSTAEFTGQFWCDGIWLLFEFFCNLWIYSSTLVSSLLPQYPCHSKLERVGLGSTVRINPINTRGWGRRLAAEGLARGDDGRMRDIYIKKMVLLITVTCAQQDVRRDKQQFYNIYENRLMICINWSVTDKLWPE